MAERGQKFFYTRDYPNTEQGPEIFYGDPENHYMPIESLERAQELAEIMLRTPDTGARYGVSWDADGTN